MLKKILNYHRIYSPMGEEIGFAIRRLPYTALCFHRNKTNGVVGITLLTPKFLLCLNNEYWGFRFTSIWKESACKEVL